MALINLRNALMTGKRLPYDAEVEYLESTGTQWIDTGIEGTSDLDVDCVVSSATSPNQAILGIIQNAPAGYSGYFRYHYSPYADRARFWVQINALNTASIVLDFTPDKIYHWTVHPTLGIANCNGTSVSFTALPQGVRSGLNFYIFARNGFGGIQSMPNKVYSFKIWQNGTLVRDYIPVRKGTVGYLYDRVTHKLFGNAGTGDFVLGPDVVPVEYIESHGTEWIDTGVVPNNSTGFTVDAMAIGAVLNMRILGVYETISGEQQRFAAVVRSGGNSINARQFYFGWGAAYNFTASESNFMTRRVMGLNFLNSRNMTFDGGVVSSNLPTLASFTTSAWLFGNRGNEELSAQRIYRCKMSSGNEIVRDFIPVRKGTVGYLYDRVSGELFGNAGTGAFTYGNDLKYPIPAE